MTKINAFIIPRSYILWINTNYNRTKSYIWLLIFSIFTRRISYLLSRFKDWNQFPPYMAYFLVHSLANWLYLSLVTKVVIKIKINILSITFKPVSFEDACYFWNQWIIRIWITEQRTDRQQNLADSESWWPLWSKDVQTNWPIGVDVRMINPCSKRHLWRFEWVVRWEVDGQEKHSSLIRAVWGSHDGGLPMKEIFSNWSSWALSWRITTKIL